MHNLYSRCKIPCRSSPRQSSDTGHRAASLLDLSYLCSAPMRSRAPRTTCKCRQPHFIATCEHSSDHCIASSLVQQHQHQCQTLRVFRPRQSSGSAPVGQGWRGSVPLEQSHTAVNSASTEMHHSGVRTLGQQSSRTTKTCSTGLNAATLACGLYIACSNEFALTSSNLLNVRQRHNISRMRSAREHSTQLYALTRIRSSFKC